MANRLRRGAERLTNRLEAKVSTIVDYQRPGEWTIESVPARIGRTLFRLDLGQAGQKIEWGDRDYLIRASYFELQGLAIVPKRGDRIVDSDGTYEVLPPPGETPYRTSDAFGVQFRLHTKKVS